MAEYQWPPEGVPSFISSTGEPGSWRPVCDEHGGEVELTHRFTPWGSWHCPRCGMTHLIWAEDWPDAEEPDDRPEHIITVGFSVRGQSREDAHRNLHRVLPVPTESPDLEQWWVAEDDRLDGSDNDSAVYIPMGSQAAVSRLLAAAGLTPPHNVIRGDR